MTKKRDTIEVRGANQHNLKGIDVSIPRHAITVITGLSGSGKSSLAFDTVLAEAQRRFFYTLSNYTRQFLDVSARPDVRSVSGLSPSISLAQNETPPSRRATVATLSDLGELFGVLFARFADPSCPKHGILTEKMSAAEIATKILAEHGERICAVVAPVVDDKKGHFRSKFEKFAKQGFMKALVDGDLVDIVPPPDLSKEKKHTIKIVTDMLKITPANQARLIRGIETAANEGEGALEIIPFAKDRRVLLAELIRYSTKGGCPECGFAWPRLDSRYFASGSLGRCLSCNGYGEVDITEEAQELLDRLDQADHLCRDCAGTGLKSELNAIRFNDISLPEIHQLSIRNIRQLVQGWQEKIPNGAPALARVLQEILGVLLRLDNVGLSYVHPARRVVSLSGGEAQRLRLSGVLGEHLRGILYVLDEPSQGLHAKELDKIAAILQKLRDSGNTVIVVDHDEQIMRHADYIIDLGPGGGADGGHLLAGFAPADAAQFKAISKTAAVLAERQQPFAPIDRHAEIDGEITITEPRLHNLRIPSVSFKRASLNVVLGVSGAGKTSLVKGVLFENLNAQIKTAKRPKPRYCQALEYDEAFERVLMIDRKPIAKSSVSMPLSYLGALTPIRELFAALPDAQVAGLKPRDFSLQVEGGRCSECGGRGEILLSMRFLPDARVPCDLCEGLRYRPHVLQVRYAGYSIGDILNLTIEEAYDLLHRVRKVERILKPAVDMGLGYLKVGQPTASLSGGEAQRLKLAPMMGKRYGLETIVVMDEPTRGLHGADIKKLLTAIEALLQKGVTIVMIEHNLDMLRAAHWAVELGPGAAELGGHLLYQGMPAGLMAVKDSPTRPYL